VTRKINRGARQGIESNTGVSPWSREVIEGFWFFGDLLVEETMIRRKDGWRAVLNADVILHQVDHSIMWSTTLLARKHDVGVGYGQGEGCNRAGIGQACARGDRDCFRSECSQDRDLCKTGSAPMLMPGSSTS